MKGRLFTCIIKYMNINIFLSLYAISVPIFFAIDMLWLGLIASSFYKQQLSGLMGDINWPAAILFYFVFLVGLTFFAIYPAVQKDSVLTGLMLGCLFGFFTYATYDLTNLATLKNWPILISVVDIIWGTILGGLVSAVTVFVYGWLH